MAIQINSNIDEELEKFEQLKELINELNNANVEEEKIFVDMEYIAKLCKCSERRAREVIEKHGIPQIRLGKKPVVNILAFIEYTKVNNLD